MNIDLQSSIVINPAKSLYGRVNIINKRENLIESNLIVVRKDHELESSLRVVYSSEIESSITIVQSVESYLNASIIVNAHSSLYGIVDMQPIPRQYANLIPTKDVHVREDIPTFNLGGQEVMYIGNKDGYRYRTFIGFDLTDVIPDGMIITNAKLKLNFTSENEFKDFELSVLNRDWHEYGTTWNYQPTRKEIILETDIIDGVYNVSYDVKDIVTRWNSFEVPNYGFLLKATDSTEDISKFKGIFSRESFLPPELEIEYIDPKVINPRRNVFNSSIIVKQNNFSYIDTSIEIPLYYGDFTLDSNINVFNHKMIESSISVNRRVLSSSLTVIQNNNSDLDSNINVYQKKVNDLNSYFTINKNNLPAWIDLRKHTSLNSEIFVKISQEANTVLDSTIVISKKSLPSSIKIRSTSQIEGYLTVYKRKTSDIDTSLIISKPNLSANLRVRRCSEIDGNLKIRSKTNIDGNINIRQHFNIDGNLLIRSKTSLDSNISINKTVFGSSLFIRGKSELDSIIKVRPHDSLKSYIIVRHFNDLDSNIIVKQRFFSDINGSIIIGKIEKRKSYAFIM